MTCHSPERASEIDWTTGFVWVARKGLVQIVATDPATDMLTLEREDGSRLTLHRTVFETEYQPTSDPRCFKPVYAPVKARAVPAPMTIEIDGAPQHLAASDALLLLSDGRLRSVSAAVYRRDYTAVSRSDDLRFPTIPFPD
ncbi:MAG: hypothetical protein AAF899_12480 [Pseudomonadota bacterium]